MGYTPGYTASRRLQNTAGYQTAKPQVLQMLQAPKTQQPLGSEFPGWEPSQRMRSTPASQQVVPYVEPSLCLTLLMSHPSARRSENEVLDLEAIRF